MKKYKVVFCGTPIIASEVLETLLNVDEIDVVGVITQPDRLVGRKKVLTPSPVKKVAQAHKLRCFQPEKVNEIYEELEKLDYDVLLTCAYGQFIPTRILSLSKIDNLNLHASLLPKYRGGAPIQHAIMNGETKTGISLMRMVKQMDAGAVFVMREVEIDRLDNNETLFKKLAKVAQKIVTDDLINVFEKKIVPISQDESKVSFAPIISSKDEQILWNKSSMIIYNQVRALFPSPIAYTMLGDERLKIGKTEIVFDLMILKKFSNNSDGEILGFDQKGLLVKTNDGVLRILEVQKAGKTMQPALNYSNNPFFKSGYKFATI